MQSVHLEIEGMSCAHCVRAIRDRLSSTPGVEVTDVKIGSADIRYDPSLVSTADLQDAVSDEGYTIDTISDLAR